MINFTKLSKALQGNKRRIMWFKREGFNYIACDYFLLMTKKEVTGSALTKLVTLLENIPGEGEGFQVIDGFRKKMNLAEMDRILNLLRPGNHFKPVEDTKLLTEIPDKTVRIYRTSSNEYIYLDKAYTDLIDFKSNDIAVISDKPTSPVFFTSGDDMAMLLPIRWEGPVILYLKESKSL